MAENRQDGDGPPGNRKFLILRCSERVQGLLRWWRVAGTAMRGGTLRLLPPALTEAFRASKLPHRGVEM
jgi:hypothetical protein